MNIWQLPTTIEVNGRSYKIRTDYRAIIDVLMAFCDKETQGDTEQETNYIRARIMVDIMVLDKLDPSDFKGAVEELTKFIDMDTGDDDDGKPKPRLMDWAQDASLIIPAVNRVVGKEVREVEYMHWWTFLSAYMEIGECSFTHILSIRQKKSKGKKLEKWEQEYIRENPRVMLHEQLTDEEIEQQKLEKEAIKNLFS